MLRGRKSLPREWEAQRMALSVNPGVTSTPGGESESSVVRGPQQERTLDA